ISGAITMNMISSTSTTSTSGVMLMDACILPGSPSRICLSSLIDRHLDVRFLQLHIELRDPGLRYLEQVVHELRRCPVHLDVESLDFAREVIEGNDGRDCNEDAQGRRDEGFSDAARDDRHPARTCGCDVPESVDDSDYRTEEADKRRAGSDCCQESEAALQLNQRLGQGVPECARNELERGALISTALSHALIFEGAR